MRIILRPPSRIVEPEPKDLQMLEVNDEILKIKGKLQLLESEK